MLGFFTPYFFVGDYAAALNLSDKVVQVSLTLIGAANGVGRLLGGFLSDRPWCDSIILTNVTLLLSALVHFLLPFLEDWGEIAIYGYSLCCGLFLAPFISLRSIIVVDLLGLDKLTAAYGFLLLAMGLAAFVGSPVLSKFFLFYELIILTSNVFSFFLYNSWNR